MGDKSHFDGVDVEVLAYNVGWTEGPAWNPKEKALYYSDCIGDMIYRWTEATGAEVFLKKSGGHNPSTDNILDYEKRLMPGSNGLAIHDDYLYICQHGLGQISKIKISDAKKGTFLYENDVTVVAKAYAGQRLNSPNDLVFDKNGDMWFTDPEYGFEYKHQYAKQSKIGERCKDLGLGCTHYHGVYRLKKGAALDGVEMISDL